MNNFRRRIGNSISYVFKAQSTSVSIGLDGGYPNVNITSTVNGTNIGYSVVSYDGTVVTNVRTAATSITIDCSANSTYNQRNGNVVLKQNDSNKTITINVSQSACPLAFNNSGILLDGTSGSYGSVSVTGGGNISFSNIPSWVNITHSSNNINVTASSNNSASTARLDTITVIGGSQSTSLTIIQLPSDYHSRNYVSIGGVNWAIKNVGASQVKDYGNYYMYGKGSRTYNSSDSIYEGTENPLASSADTATQVMGSGWRMPTYSEFYNLCTNSKYWVYYNGVNGEVLNSNGDVLFFPTAGIYDKNGNLVDAGKSGCVWTSTPYNSMWVYYLNFTSYSSSYVNLSASDVRNLGFSVRGVHA